MNCSSTTIAASVNLSGKSGYRADIDGLRATAVIAVIINHLEKSLLPSGHLGVDIFFVISGFVITSSLMNHKRIDFRSFLAGFYVRRFKRLLPALILFSIISSLLLCLVNPNPGASLRTGIAALFGFSNVYLLFQETNYFSSDADLNIFTHTWSLGVEEQFYLIFPVLFWFSGLTKNASRVHAFRFAAILSAFMVISWITFKHLSSINPSAAFFLMPARFWELGSGSLGFLFCYYAPNTLIKRLHYPLPIFLLLISSLAIGVQPWLSPYRLTTLIVALTSLLLLNLQPDTFCRNLLSIGPLVKIGLMSYSLYLWHWTFTCLARWTIGIHLSTIPLILGLTIATSILSNQQIENRFRYRIPKLPPRKVLGIGLASSSVAAGFLLFLSGWLHSKFFLSVNNPQDRFEEVDGFSIYYNCNYYQGMRKFSPEKDFARCTFKPNASNLSRGKRKAPHIYFLGNSHASQLTGMIERLREISSQQQTLLMTGAIMSPPLPKDSMNSPYNTSAWTNEGINVQERIANQTLINSQPGDIILLGNNLDSFATSSKDSKEAANKKNKAMKAWLEKLSAFVGDAETHQLKVIVLTPIPYFDPVQGLTVELCIPTWFRPSIAPKCFASGDREEIKKSLAVINTNLSAMQHKHKNLYLFNPFDIICPGETCLNYNSAGRLYTDNGHLNNRGSRLLATPFLTFLKDHDLL